MQVRTMAEVFAAGETPEVLFWVGCAGSFDQRAQKITKAFATILNKVGVSYAILGKEEMCTGDPARRAGNEFLFQMMEPSNGRLPLYGNNDGAYVLPLSECDFTDYRPAIQSTHFQDSGQRGAGRPTPNRTNGYQRSSGLDKGTNVYSNGRERTIHSSNEH